MVVPLLWLAIGCDDTLRLRVCSCSGAMPSDTPGRDLGPASAEKLRREQSGLVARSSPSFERIHLPAGQPQPSWKTSNASAMGDAHPLPGLPATRPRGTRPGRSSPSRARRCRPGARERLDTSVEGVGRVDAVPAVGEPAAHTCWTPPHGSSPSVSWSGNTQRLPASRTASRVARPVAMWSAWLSIVPPQVSRKLLVITISGRCRRTTAQIARRSATPYSRTPSGSPRNSTVVDPDDPRRLDLLGLADPATLVGRHAVDARPRRWSPCSRRPPCPARSSGRRRRRRRTPCRRDGRRRPGRGPSPRGAVRAGEVAVDLRACHGSTGERAPPCVPTSRSR